MRVWQLTIVALLLLMAVFKLTTPGLSDSIKEEMRWNDHDFILDG